MCRVWQEVILLDKCLAGELDSTISPRQRKTEKPARSIERKRTVIMGRRVMGGEQEEEIVNGECPLLVRNGRAVELVHACERTGYEGGIVSSTHMREMRLQGVTDAG
jgi:hypothetical protein